MIIATKDEYVRMHSQPIGEPALHVQVGASQKDRDKRAKAQWIRDGKIIARREELRREYDERVSAGEIRTPSRTERYIAAANGHPENESTQAARRILKKMGVSWE